MTPVIDEILLRVHTDEGMRSIEKVANLIRKEWVTGIKLIDNREYCFADFGLEDIRWMADDPVSLDRHLAECLRIKYLPISRVFYESGEVAYRRVGEFKFYPNHFYPYHVLDTDMVNGDTIKLACRILDTSRYTVPIKVEKNQDLIDIEDLFMNNSLLQTNDGIKKCNYLLNWKFFIKRTSLPTIIYEPMCELFKHESKT